MNSPLLLELPPCGQVQVAKIRDVALASRALIHSRDGGNVIFLYSFMYLLFEDNDVGI